MTTAQLMFQHIDVPGFKSHKYNYDPYKAKKYISFADWILPQFIQMVSDVVASLQPVHVSYIHPRSGYEALQCWDGNDFVLVVWGRNSETDTFWAGTVNDFSSYLKWQSAPKGVNIVHAYTADQLSEIISTLTSWLDREKQCESCFHLGAEA